ncbi:ATP-dependent RNA helicase DHX36-like protein, partial [Trifolium medium]|nr:ATP-dependent RNA helicase DHX36-like protein [Trifolium medium]
MKDRPSLSSHGAIYVPPHHRLRSVITSTNSPAPVSAKFRENHTPAVPTTLQTPLSANSRFVSAYDDVISEDWSHREVELPSLP